jgi:hypothetical protein
MPVAQAILALVGAYAAIGLLFGAAFVLRGAGAVDPGARGAPWGFRALIFPGSVALWPILLRLWLRARRGA